jgi:hypothetical protein
MADHEEVALAQIVFHFLQADFDVEHLATIRYREPKYSVVLRRATWPE